MAEALDIHPFMLSRWRKEYREGKYGMANKTPKPDGKLKEQDEVKHGLHPLYRTRINKKT